MTFFIRSMGSGSDTGSSASSMATWFPAGPPLVLRVLTGRKARKPSMESTSRSRASRKRRMAAVVVATTTSLMVPPSAFFTAFTSPRSNEVQSKRRYGLMSGAVKGLSGPAFIPDWSTRTTPPKFSRMRGPKCESLRKPLMRCLTSARRSCVRVGAGRGVHALGSFSVTTGVI